MAKVLLTPGPSNPGEEVLKALSSPVVSHRGSEFRKLFSEVREKLMSVYRTASDVAILTGSGTLAVDAMIYSMVEPGDKVLLVSHGVFARRMLRSIRARGAEAEVLEAEPGEAVDPERVEEAVERKRPNVLAMVFTETSTGLAYRVARRVALRAKEMGLFVIVDAVSALGGERLGVEDHGFDAVASCSHKALASPPGLSFVALSSDGVKRVSSTSNKPLYLDLAVYLERHKRMETPATPAVNVFYALNAALSTIIEVGLDRWVLMHEERARLLYGELPKLGLRPLVRNADYRSNTVTVFEVPRGVRATELVGCVAGKGFVISPGMEELRERLVRVGTMGAIDLKILRGLVNALEECLTGLRSPGTAGRC